MKTSQVLIWIAVLFLGSMCAPQQEHQENGQNLTPSQTTIEQNPSAFKGAKLTFKVIESPNETYGYDIYADDRLVIHQPNVPGTNSTDGFKTRQAAGKVAKLIVDKLREGKSASISVKEMKELNAIE